MASRIKWTFVLLILIFSSFVVLAQPNNKGTEYDLPKKRLLIKTIGLYVHASNQGMIDLDSAMVLACLSQRLPSSFSYYEYYAADNNESDELFNPYHELRTNELQTLLTNAKAEKRSRLLMASAAYYLFKPGNLKADLENALRYLQSASKLGDSLSGNWLQLKCKMLLAEYYAQANEGEKMQPQIEQLIIEARNTKDNNLLAFCLDKAGSLLPKSDSIKVLFLQEAKLLYRRLQQPERECEMSMRILGVHFWDGKMERTLRELNESLQQQNSIKFRHTHYTTTVISYVELMLGNHNRSLEAALSSIHTMEALNDTAFSDYFYLRLGNVYHNLDRYEEAIAIFRKGLQKSNHKEDNKIWYKGFLSTVSSISQQGRHHESLRLIQSFSRDYPPQNDFDRMYLAQQTAICYEALGNPSSAESNYKQMVRYAGQLKPQETSGDVAWCYAWMANFYAKKGSAQDAAFYVDQAQSIPASRDRVFTQRLLSLVRFKIDSINGNFRSAVENYQAYKILDDSIVSINKNKQIEEIRIRYETAKKEESIQALETQALLQQAELKKSKLLRTLILSMLGLVLVIFFLLLNRYKMKQRTNLQLTELVYQKETLLKDKDWLLKEIHHRVKNNLQMVMSLLRTQSSYLHSQEAVSAIRDSQRRMQAMSLIHQKLYESDNVSSVDMKKYIEQLIRYLRDSFGTQEVKFDLNVDDIRLDVVQAVPVGLILNEGVANAMKYAFPNGQGMIAISLRLREDKMIALSIHDNGSGLPAEFLRSSKKSFGLNLMRGLTNQLGGELNISGTNGVEINVTFQLEVLSVRSMTDDR